MQEMLYFPANFIHSTEVWLLMACVCVFAFVFCVFQTRVWLRVIDVHLWSLFRRLQLMGSLSNCMFAALSLLCFRQTMKAVFGSMISEERGFKVFTGTVHLKCRGVLKTMSNTTHFPETIKALWLYSLW